MALLSATLLSAGFPHAVHEVQVLAPPHTTWETFAVEEERDEQALAHRPSHLDPHPELSNSTCVGNYALPDVYIIGEENCGTSTVDAWFKQPPFNLSIADACPGKIFTAAHTAECHIFDEMCGWDARKAALMDATNAVGACPAPSNASSKLLVASAVTNGFLGCKQRAGTLLLDKSPTYSRLVGLPAFIAGQYGSAGAARLSMIVMLREPLSRMHSAWQQMAVNNQAYSNSVPYLSTAQDYTTMLRATLPNNYSKLLARGVNSLVIRSYVYECGARPPNPVTPRPPHRCDRRVCPCACTALTPRRPCVGAACSRARCTGRRWGNGSTRLGARCSCSR